MTPAEYRSLIARPARTIKPRIFAPGITVKWHYDSHGKLLLTLPEPPSVDTLYSTVRNRRVLSKYGRDYKAFVQAGLLGVKPFTSPVAVSITWYRARMAGDLDNRLKACLDALSGICYTDDKLIAEIHAFRVDDESAARVEIEIWVIV